MVEQTSYGLGDFAWGSMVALERIELGSATALMEKATHDESAEVRAWAQAYLGRQTQG